MRFGDKLGRWVLGIIGLSGDEYSGVGRDTALAIPMGFAVLVLIVYLSERHSSERLKYAALVSLAVLSVGLLLAKRKVIVVGAIAAIVGFRGLVAIAQGLWQGVIIASIATIIVIFCIQSADHS